MRRLLQGFLIVLAIALILPQTVAVVQMGMSVVHGGHDTAPVETCSNALACLWAHQPSVLPVVNPLEGLFVLLLIAVIVIVRLLIGVRSNPTDSQYIRQFLRRHVGIHMHAFSASRQWIAQGLMSQKITEVLA